MRNSGKLLILGILALAVLMAGASWWFRFRATHRAAEFWGPNVSRLVRDGTIVELFRFKPNSSDGFEQLDELGQFLDRPTSRSDISNARGLIHLRTALLEDGSYVWPDRPLSSDDHWQWALAFRRDKESGPVVLVFSPNWQSVTRLGPVARDSYGPFYVKKGVGAATVLSCEPISKGLQEMLANLAEEPPET